MKLIPRLSPTIIIFTFMSLVGCGGGGGGGGGNEMPSSALIQSSNSSTSNSANSSSPITSKGFQKPFILFSSKNILTKLSGHAVATNDQGESMLIWSDINDKYLTVLSGVKIYKDGGVSPIYHFSNPAHHATSPEVSINNQGDVNFAWIDEVDVDESIEQIWTRNVSGSGEVDSLVRLDQLDISPDIHGPESLIFDNGDVIVVWSQDRRMYSSFYRKGEGWSTPKAIDENIGSSTRPVIAKDNRGNVLVAWKQILPENFVGYSETIATNYFTPEQGWTGINYFKDEINDFQDPVLAMNNEGNAILAWTETGFSNEVYSSYFTPKGGWSETQKHPLENPLVTSGVQVDINNRGEAVLGWRTRTDRDQVRVTHYSPTVGWDEPAVINAAPNEEITGSLSIKIGESGLAMMAWTQGHYITATYGNNVNVKLTTYEPKLGWSTPKNISGISSNGTYLNPNIVLVENSNIFISWGEITDTLEERVWISRYFE